MPLTPPAIDKQLADIDLKQGVNEHLDPAVNDWTKFFTRMDNVSFENYGVASKRKGLIALITETLDSSIGQMNRAFPLPGGFAVTQRKDPNQSTTEFLDIREGASPKFTSKGTWPKYDVSRKAAGSSGAGGFGAGSFGIRVCSVGLTDNYEVILIKDAIADGQPYVINLIDRNSDCIVRSWSYNIAPLEIIEDLRLVVVNGQFLDVFARTIGGGGYCFTFRIDTSDGVIPDSGEINPPFTVLNSTSIIVEPINYGTGSAIIHQNGDIQIFDGTGTSILTGNVPGFTQVTGWTTDGSNFYVVGYNATHWVHKKVSSALAVLTTDSIVRVFDGVPRVAYVQSTNTVYEVIYIGYEFSAGLKWPMAEIYSFQPGGAATKINTIHGWCEASLPFVADDTPYVVMANQMTSNSGANQERSTVANAVAVLDITAPTDDKRILPEAVIDTYIGSLEANDPDTGAYDQSMNAYPHRPIMESVALEQEFIIGLMSKDVATGFGFDLVRISPASPSKYSGHEDCYSAGGYCIYYDNNIPMEFGFIHAPSAMAEYFTPGPAPVAGIYNYIAVYEYRAANGQSRFSRTSIPMNVVTVAAGSIRVQVAPPNVTRCHALSSMDRGVVHLYRTASGGTEYYLVASRPLYDDAVVSFEDMTTDAALISKPRLFRQPSVAGSALDRFHTISSNCMVKHKDRVFYASGKNVYYSSFIVDGEAPWFNPQFSIHIPGGSGDVTALASMDGVLVIFKKDSVFLVDGDGPPEGGGNGTEFSTPRRIQTEFGCIDQRSVVPIPEGIIYRSHRGIEMLGTNGRIKFIGENVSKTADDHPYTAGAIFDRKVGRVLIMVGISESAGAVVGQKILAYDLTAGAWSVWNYNTTLFSLVYSPNIYAGDGIVIGDVFYLGTNSVFCEYDDYCIDNGVLVPPPIGEFQGEYVSMVFETPWIRLSQQDRIFVESLFILTRNLDNHDLMVEIAYDWDETYITAQANIFEADYFVGQPVRQLEYQVPYPECQAVRFRITDTAPSDTGSFPVHKGKGPQVLGYTVKLGKIGDGVKLHHNSKG